MLILVEKHHYMHYGAYVIDIPDSGYEPFRQWLRYIVDYHGFCDCVGLDRLEKIPEFCNNYVVGNEWKYINHHYDHIDIDLDLEKLVDDVKSALLKLETAIHISASPKSETDMDVSTPDNYNIETDKIKVRNYMTTKELEDTPRSRILIFIDGKIETIHDMMYDDEIFIPEDDQITNLANMLLSLIPKFAQTEMDKYIRAKDYGKRMEDIRRTRISNNMPNIDRSDKARMEYRRIKEMLKR